jgi:transcriptional regulator with XRE-family HTH domain
MLARSNSSGEGLRKGIGDDLVFAVGRRLRRYREAIGLSQSLVAQHLGVTQVAISNWELGRSQAGYVQLTTLSHVYGVPVGDFFFVTEASADGDGAGVNRRFEQRLERIERELGLAAET